MRASSRPFGVIRRSKVHKKAAGFCPPPSCEAPFERLLLAALIAQARLRRASSLFGRKPFRVQSASASGTVAVEPSSLVMLSPVNTNDFGSVTGSGVAASSRAGVRSGSALWQAVSVNGSVSARSRARIFSSGIPPLFRRFPLKTGRYDGIMGARVRRRIIVLGGRITLNRAAERSQGCAACRRFMSPVILFHRTPICKGVCANLQKMPRALSLKARGAAPILRPSSRESRPGCS